MVANNNDDYLLTQLFATDQVLFDEKFIKTIVALGTQAIYTIKHTGDMSNLLLSATFSQYAFSNTATGRQAFMKLFDVYFRAVGKYTGQSPIPLRTRILAFLGMSFSIPTTAILPMQDAKITITTNYKPKEVDMISTKMDIETIIKDQLHDAITNTTPIEMTYTNIPSSVQLQGAVLPFIITDILILQEEMLRATTSDSIQVKPFINAQKIETPHSMLLQ